MASGKPVLVVGIAAVLFIGYVALVELTAVRKAEAFCRDTAIGSSVEHLNERAAAAGAVDLNNPAAWDRAPERHIRWVRVPGGNEILPVTFLGFAGQLQHICSITARDGIVAYTEDKHLD